MAARLACALLLSGGLAWALGCATPPVPAHEGTLEAALEAKVEPEVIIDRVALRKQWAGEVRAGRDAMRLASMALDNSIIEGSKKTSAGSPAVAPTLLSHYGEAEQRFMTALDHTGHFPAHDSRIHTTLGNLVGLAARYHKAKEVDVAADIMEQVGAYVVARGVPPFGGKSYADRYYELSLDTRPRVSPRFRIRAPRVPVDHRYDVLIRSTARDFHMDPALVKAVVAAESNFKSTAVSRVGAQGLMQLMPATAEEMGVSEPYEPSDNLKGGVRYLRKMLDRYGDLRHALAAYNAGPAAVDRYGGVPPYAETRAYVKRVLGYYRGYQGNLAN